MASRRFETAARMRSTRSCETSIASSSSSSVGAVRTASCFCVVGCAAPSAALIQVPLSAAHAFCERPSGLSVLKYNTQASYEEPPPGASAHERPQRYSSSHNPSSGRSSNHANAVSSSSSLGSPPHTEGWMVNTPDDANARHVVGSVASSQSMPHAPRGVPHRRSGGLVVAAFVAESSTMSIAAHESQTWLVCSQSQRHDRAYRPTSRSAGTTTASTTETLSKGPKPTGASAEGGANCVAFGSCPETPPNAVTGFIVHAEPSGHVPIRRRFACHGAVRVPSAYSATCVSEAYSRTVCWKHASVCHASCALAGFLQRRYEYPPP
mmetsp:Transcript_10923/g.44268  ORF Transcript_10923/g.44268 Transcript_10923/m.44268 type:complete len:323 (+) Transcript_10923:215-1183(+)